MTLRSAFWGPALYGVAVLLLLLGQWKPLDFVHDSAEPWVLVLSEAAAGRYHFGTDLAFTSGPLADLYSQFFNPRTFHVSLIVQYGLVTLQALAAWVLAMRARTLFFPILLLLSLLLIVWRDVLLLATPLLVTLVALGRPTDRLSVAMTVAGTVGAAATTLAKFTLFPASLGLFVLVDVARLRRRRLPVATACYALALWLAFVLLAPEGSDFAAFLSSSLDLASGYAAAMATTGPVIDWAVYGALAAAGAGAVAIIEWRRAERDGWSAAISLAALLLFLWITLKLGFVRHDLHVLFAFSGLALGLCLHALSRADAPGRLACTLMTAAVLGAGFFGHVRMGADLPAYPLSTTLPLALKAAPAEIVRSVRAIATPSEWRAERQRKHEESLAATARRSPVPGLAGTVDAIVQVQAALLADGRDYRPRPTIQEFTSYTSGVIERNRAFLRGPAAPETLLFAPGSIDNRHPALTEGPLWPLLLTHYMPVRELGGILMLRRRGQPLADVLGPAEPGIGRLGDRLPIAFGDEPLFVSIDVRPTLLGRVAEILFKPPMLHLGVTMGDGTEQVFRLVSGIAREGFIASPLVRTAADFARLAEGRPVDAAARVVALRVIGSAGRGLAYRQAIPYTVRRIDGARLRGGE